MENNNSEIQKLEEQLRENPDSPVFARLASLYIDSGEYVHALALSDRGTALYPEYATGFLLRAHALYHLEKYNEAIENYNKVLDIVPRCPVVVKRLEELYSKTKQDEQIVTTGVDEELSADTDEQQSIENLAERLKDYKPTRPEKSELREAPGEDDSIAEDDDLPIISETLASIFFKQKQYDKAIEAYRQLIKRTPEKADIYLSKMKEVEEAKKNDA